MRWPTIMLPGRGLMGHESMNEAPGGFKRRRAPILPTACARYTRLMRSALLVWAPCSPSAPAARRRRSRATFTRSTAWRAKREAGLRAPDGWLSVVGLHWLREGTSTIGSAKGSDILLPLPAPPRVGTLELDKGSAVIHVAPGVIVTSQDKPVTELELQSDKDGARPTCWRSAP